jgi:hypothetical protein
MRKPSIACESESPNPLYWIAVFLIAACAVGLRFAIKGRDLEIGNFIVSVISGLCLAVVICGLINFKNSPIQPKGGNG